MQLSDPETHLLIVKLEWFHLPMNGLNTKLWFVRHTYIHIQLVIQATTCRFHLLSDLKTYNLNYPSLQNQKLGSMKNPTII